MSIRTDTEEGDGPEEFVELETPQPPLDGQIPVHFPDGQIGRCRIDHKTGHIIITSMWMPR